MFQKLKELVKYDPNRGFNVWMGYDPDKKGPSFTLFMTAVTFLLAIISVVMLHFYERLVIATSVSLVFWTLATVFYMLRTLSKAKIDLDDREIELDSGQENNKEDKENE